MAAYLIADIEVTDPEAYEQYRLQTPATLAAYGGRFLVRGGAAQVLEGDWAPSRVIVVEFDSMEQAQRWAESPEYRAIKGIRQAAARSSLVLIEGV